MSEQAFGDVEQVVTVALIVLVIAVVWVVKETNSSYLIPNGDDGLSTDLYYLKDFVVTGVLLPDVFKRTV